MHIKVVFKKDTERFPHFIVPKGTIGHLLHCDNGEVAVQLNKPIAGCEAWDQVVYWDCSDGFSTAQLLNEELELTFAH